MRSYYQLMQQNEENYPDPLTLKTHKFQFTDMPLEVTLTSKDIERIDALVYNYYETSEFFDLILDINGIGYIKDISPGFILKLPVRTDLENFITRNKIL